MWEELGISGKEVKDDIDEIMEKELEEKNKNKTK